MAHSHPSDFFNPSDLPSGQQDHLFDFIGNSHQDLPSGQQGHSFNFTGSSRQDSPSGQHDHSFDFTGGSQWTHQVFWKAYFRSQRDSLMVLVLFDAITAIVPRVTTVHALWCPDTPRSRVTGEQAFIWNVQIARLTSTRWCPQCSLPKYNKVPVSRWANWHHSRIETDLALACTGYNSISDRRPCATSCQQGNGTVCTGFQCYSEVRRCSKGQTQEH